MFATFKLPGGVFTEYYSGPEDNLALLAFVVNLANSWRFLYVVTSLAIKLVTILATR